jgi:hypothetical protein
LFVDSPTGVVKIEPLFRPRKTIRRGRNASPVKHPEPRCTKGFQTSDFMLRKKGYAFNMLPFGGQLPAKQNNGSQAFGHPYTK